MFQAFTDYVTALQEVVTTKLPDTVTKAGRIIDEASDVKNYAEPQFDRLDPVSKGKAIMAMSSNMNQITKMPKLIEQALKDLKEDL